MRENNNNRVREKVSRNSGGFRLNLIFVDCTSVFVKSVLEASLSFTYILAVVTLQTFT